MWTVRVYGYDKVLVIRCDTYGEALDERNLRAGMGLVIEIEMD